MSDSELFFDFDQAIGELEPRLYSFLYEGEKYTIDLNVDGGRLLLWMEHADTIKALPHLLRVFLNEDQFDKIMASGAVWPKLELLVSKLAEQLGSGTDGDSGN